MNELTFIPDIRQDGSSRHQLCHIRIYKIKIISVKVRGRRRKTVAEVVGATSSEVLSNIISHLRKKLKFINRARVAATQWQAYSRPSVVAVERVGAERARTVCNFNLFTAIIVAFDTVAH